MDIKESYELLKYIVETPEEKLALDTLANAAESATSTVERASYKQFKFMNDMALASGSTLKDELDKRGIEHTNNLKDISKDQAKKLISEFISLGYKDKLSGRY